MKKLCDLYTENVASKIKMLLHSLCVLQIVQQSDYQAVTPHPPTHLIRNCLIIKQLEKSSLTYSSTIL